MTQRQAELLLLLAAAIWGLSFVAQKTAMSSIGPMTFIAARAVTAALVLLPFALYEQRNTSRSVEPRFWTLVVASGVVFLFASAFQQFGLLTASVTNAGFLTSLYVVLVPVLTWFIFQQAPAWPVWVAVGLCCAGTWLLSGADALSLSSGDMLVTICAVFWALHVIVTGAAAHHGRPFLFTAAQFFVVGVVAMAGALATETISPAMLYAAWPEIAYVGVLSSALTFSLLVIALRHTKPVKAAILLSTENVFAALGAAVVLGERLASINWTGAALIVAAILLVQFRDAARCAES
jgi:drug/metabolite transporter (DMT)-like permease